MPRPEPGITRLDLPEIAAFPLGLLVPQTEVSPRAPWRRRRPVFFAGSEKEPEWVSSLPTWVESLPPSCAFSGRNSMARRPSRGGRLA